MLNLLTIWLIMNREIFSCQNLVFSLTSDHGHQRILIRTKTAQFYVYKRLCFEWQELLEALIAHARPGLNLGSGQITHAHTFRGPHEYSNYTQNKTSAIMESLTGT